MPRIQPMNILDYERAGRIVVAWAQGKTPPPKDMEDMRQQLAGIVEIPERYQRLSVVQGDNHHFILRLPPKDQVTQSEEDVLQDLEDEKNTGERRSYELPQFYKDMLLESGLWNNATFFYSRISDYTIRGCK